MRTTVEVPAEFAPSRPDAVVGDQRSPSRAAPSSSRDKETIMLFTIALVLFVLWALGLVSGYAMGGLIHMLLVVALIVVVLQFLSGRRAV
jgi:nitrate reductase NapE component